MLDSVFIGRMIGIMKTSYPDLQRKAASILEFITIIDPSMDTIISVDIESGLDAIFQQKALEGMGTISFCCQTKFVLYCEASRSQFNHVCSLKVGALMACLLCPARTAI